MTKPTPLGMNLILPGTHLDTSKYASVHMHACELLCLYHIMINELQNCFPNHQNVWATGFQMYYMNLDYIPYKYIIFISYMF